jgi:hypothetical protein
MLRVGSKGPDVVEWQMFLKEHGYFKAGVAPSFGPKTYAATVGFQKDYGLGADGIVGPATRAVAKQLNTGKAVSNTVVARKAGIPERVLAALQYVESRGSAKAVRFEPHLFHRKRPDLAAQIPYTKSKRGYSTTASETNRAALLHAISVDAETAIRSTSFGKYQVLGAYLLAAYGGDPEKAYAAFEADPLGASNLMVAAWFKDNPKAREAANADPVDWTLLARCYNGPKYYVHKYDERLEAAYKEQS